MNPIISIIIPCYNSGLYLTEAINSVKEYKGEYGYEIIIADDGSTDSATKDLLNDLKQKNFKVFHQENKGPGAARNLGCRNALGEFLLFLDSDNKIYTEYIDIGIASLKKDKAIAVVYGNPTVFGDKSRSGFRSRPFAIDEVLALNYIDVCAVVRKTAWESVGGFDESRELIGREDWEFWISLYKKGWKFLYQDRELFYYRIRSNSLMSSNDEANLNVKYVYKKHADLLAEQYLAVFLQLQIQKKDLQWSIRHLFKKAIKQFKVS